MAKESGSAFSTRLIAPWRNRVTFLLRVMADALEAHPAEHSRQRFA